jgi:chaperonin GroEL
MVLKLTCDCGNTLVADDESAEATATCPKCSRVMNIPRYRYEIFISYSSVDKKQADAVCGVLEGRNLRCFMAHRDILPGAAWAPAIVDAINSSRLFVFIFSSSSSASPEVMRELGSAASKRIPIITMRIEDAPVSKSVEYFTRETQWLDALTTPLERHLERLAEATVLSLSQAVGEVPPPRAHEPANSTAERIGSYAAGSLGAGVAKVYDLARSMLGPRGRSILLRGGAGMPLVTRSASRVLDGYCLKDSAEDLALQLIRKQADLVRGVAGYGAGITAVLTGEFFRRAVESTRTGTNAAALRKGMEMATDSVVAELRRVGRSATEERDIIAIAANSTNGDTVIGNLIAQAMEKVGKNGAITVEEARGLETTLEIVDGLQFDRGYLSAQFVTDSEKSEVILQSAKILIYEKKISSMKDLLPILEQVARQGKPLLVIAEEVESEALATLVVNKLRGTLNVAAVKAPGFGDHRKAMLEDIAILSGGKLISEELENVKWEDLGDAKSITIDKDNTTLVTNTDGNASKEAIADRVKQIRSQIEDTTSDYYREQLQERLAKLANGVAVISVGAFTEAEMKEKKARVESGLQAVRAAVDEGIVPGGGTAYVRALPVLDALAVDAAEAHGVEIIASSLDVVLRATVENAGFDPEPILVRVRASNDDFGFDVTGEQFGQMYDMGLVDSVRALRLAVQTANSLAYLLVDQTVRGSVIQDFVASVTDSSH